MECHVEPGAQGFLKAKLHGTNQLRLVITQSLSAAAAFRRRTTARPNVYTSCEQCHWPDRFIGDVVKVVYEFADDEANCEDHVDAAAPRRRAGGGHGAAGTGIHWHMNRSNVVEYVARR